jgi:hypothetical protein
MKILLENGSGLGKSIAVCWEPSNLLSLVVINHHSVLHKNVWIARNRGIRFIRLGYIKGFIR